MRVRLELTIRGSEFWAHHETWGFVIFPTIIILLLTLAPFVPFQNFAKMQMSFFGTGFAMRATDAVSALGLFVIVW